MKLRFCVTLLLLVLGAVPAFACPFCYDALKGAGSSSQAAIEHGILTLLIPPVGLMVGLVGFAFCYSRDGHQNVPGEEADAAMPVAEQELSADRR